MKIKRCYAATLLIYFSTLTFALTKGYSELQDMRDSSYQNSHFTSQQNMQLVEAFYQAYISKAVDLDEIVNAATGKLLAEKACSPKRSPYRCKDFDLTETLETLKVPQAIVAFLHHGDTPEALEVARQVEEKYKKYKGPQPKRVEALKKAQFNNVMENEWEQVIKRSRAEKNEKYRVQPQNLAKVFQEDPSSVYDVVIKRKNCIRRVTSSLYVKPEDQMPSKKRKWVSRNQEWSDRKESQELQGQGPLKKRRLGSFSEEKHNDMQ